MGVDTGRQTGGWAPRSGNSLRRGSASSPFDAVQHGRHPRPPACQLPRLTPHSSRAPPWPAPTSTPPLTVTHRPPCCLPGLIPCALKPRRARSLPPPRPPPQINSAPARGPDHFPFAGFRDSGISTQGIPKSLEFMCKTKVRPVPATTPASNHAWPPTQFCPCVGGKGCARPVRAAASAEQLRARPCTALWVRPCLRLHAACNAGLALGASHRLSVRAARGGTMGFHLADCGCLPVGFPLQTTVINLPTPSYTMG